MFTYLRENKQDLCWPVMIILKSPSIEPTARQRKSVQYLLDCPDVKRIYLSELIVDENSPLCVQIIKLIVTKKPLMRVASKYGRFPCRRGHSH